jgi:pimeloyl-ACP methyl ester carboxylesterase
VVTLDNVGVRAATGRTPNTIEAMAHDAIAFLDAMGFEQVHLLGFSIGSFVAQEIALIRPQLLRRVVLASSAPQGAAGMHGPWVDRPIGGSVRVCTRVHGRRPAGRSALGPNGGTRGKTGNQSPHSNQLDTIRKPSRSATTSASRDSWPRSTMNRFGLDAMAKNCCVVSGIVARHVSPAHSHAKASGAKADSPLIPSLTQNNL